ncbi:MAG: sulfurtransferase TusA [Pseudomonadota bacterium]|nr:sulfurtransferase TusA [Pseudomonadota bacterium]
MTSATSDVQLDTRGLFCPEPVMMLHNTIGDMQLGEVVEILATDPSTKRDFLKFCQFLGHEMLASEELDGEFRFLIRKAADDE